MRWCLIFYCKWLQFEIFTLICIACTLIQVIRLKQSTSYRLVFGIIRRRMVYYYMLMLLCRTLQWLHQGGNVSLTSLFTFQHTNLYSFIHSTLFTIEMTISSAYKYRSISSFIWPEKQQDFHCFCNQHHSRVPGTNQFIII